MRAQRAGPTHCCVNWKACNLWRPVDPVRFPAGSSFRADPPDRYRLPPPGQSGSLLSGSACGWGAPAPGQSGCVVGEGLPGIAFRRPAPPPPAHRYWLHSVPPVPRPPGCPVAGQYLHGRDRRPPQRLVPVEPPTAALVAVAHLRVMHRHHSVLAHPVLEANTLAGASTSWSSNCPSNSAAGRCPAAQDCPPAGLLFQTVRVGHNRGQRPARARLRRSMADSPLMLEPRYRSPWPTTSDPSTAANARKSRPPTGCRCPSPRPAPGYSSCPAPPPSHVFSGSPTAEPGAGWTRTPPAPCRGESTGPGTPGRRDGLQSIPRATFPVEVGSGLGLGVAHLVVGLQQ